jgi:1-acyl-sn-glycerol-3-phosphate acyltransferase
VHGAHRVPATGPLIVACNHVSYFDPPALGVAMPRPIHYMAKVELFRMPVLGPLIERLNAFPVDRSRGDVAAIKRAVEVLRTGAAIGIFPEGTRNRRGDIKPQYGVALLAALSEAPILPAYVAGSARARRLGRIEVFFGEPLFLARGQKATREDLAKWTDEIMTAIYALPRATGGN